jgi:hypothetical protein
MTPFKCTCFFSINWEMPKLKRTTMCNTRPSSCMIIHDKGRHCQRSH